MNAQPGKPVSEAAEVDAPTFDEFYENAPCGYLSLTPAGAIVRVNDTFLRWTGRTRTELLGGTRFQDLLQPGGQLYYETVCAPQLAADLSLGEVALDVRRADGTVLPTLLSAVVHPADGERPAVIRLTVFDASHRRGFERHLLAERDAERRARLHAEGLGRLADRLGLLETTAQVASALSGELVGGEFVSRAELVPRSTGPGPAGATFVATADGSGTVGAIPVHAGGEHAYGTLRVECDHQLIEAERLFLESAAEVAGRAIRRIQRAAATARATRPAGSSGLPNERWWTATLKAELERAHADQIPLTIVVVDLPQLEPLALKQGIDAADELLLAVTDAWRAAGFDLLSRFGGEEFAAVLPGLGVREAKNVVSRVRREAGASHGFAAGIACWDGSESAVGLMSRAEAALLDH